MKYAIAKTYGMAHRVNLSYVNKVFKGNTNFTTIASKAILFDNKEDLLKFANKKNIKVAEKFIRSDYFIQEIEDDVLSGQYELFDAEDGSCNFIKILRS